MMIAAQKRKTLLKKLIKQVKMLRKKEKISRNKLRSAMLKVQKLIKSHQFALAKKRKEEKLKLAATQAAIYEKLAKSIKTKAKKVRHIKLKKK